MQDKPSKGKENNALMDEMDRMILNEIQSHLPIEARPYQVLGEKLGCTEEEVLQRVQDLKDREVIRRIGANCNSRKLGYTSTLCAAKVPSRLMARFVEVVNSYMGVTPTTAAITTTISGSLSLLLPRKKSSVFCAR